MQHIKQLRYIDQLVLFKIRGVSNINLNISNEHEDSSRKQLIKQLRSIQTIGYYTLKSYAYPFFSVGTQKYKNLSFDALVTRYYRDQRFKECTLQIIEDIEVALNSRIAYLLGKKYGPFGYQNFSLWCQREGRNEFLNVSRVNKYFLAKEELNFFRDLQNKVKKSSLKDVQTFESESEKIYPSIWLTVNLLTLGTSIHLVKLMNGKLRRKLASSFNCEVQEFIGWLECLNLIRNVCCHNGNLIDITLKTKPKVPEEFSDFIYSTELENGDCIYSNKIALPLAIAVKLMRTINPKYRFEYLKKSVDKILDNTTTAEQIGFKSKNAMKNLFHTELHKSNDFSIFFPY
ncbi:Abi family protein [Liquorilactobacillus nagelii]|uniref:Abi family protein n=1 Tax=Liquorilactobacillus nagelii TaxID=82688 RepID=UPI00242C7801|nr:Abi family protein [Liquorilactobacillus nagelii]MCI1699976.1 Abi family protein [Liquorilactobacillus nagelii]